MNAVLLLNSSAGSLNGERDSVSAAELGAAFAAEGIALEPRRVEGGALAETLRAALAARPDALFVGGGDGTVSTAAGGLLDTGVPLGVLPLGTLNHFARDLGLPADWREAVRILAHAAPREVDVGEVNGRVFLNNCSIGAYPEAVRRREALRRARGTGKWWAMTLATLTVFRRLRRLRVRLESGGRTLALRTPFVVVANNRYSARVLDYSLRPRLDEGRLCIYTTRAKRHLAIARLVWQSLRREIDRVDGLDTHDCTDAILTEAHRRRLPIAVDGELVALEGPLRFRIRRQALRVLAPACPAERAPASDAAACQA